MRTKWKSLFRKEPGTSSVYILAMMFLLLMIVLFYFAFYTKSVNILADNLKDDLDSSNLASATVNLAHYSADKMDFHIIGSSTEGTRLFSYEGDKTVLAEDSEEYQEVLNHFTMYLDALRTNIGVSNSGFSGGSCGWAANFLGAENFRVEDFAIYEPEQTDTGYYLTVYEIKDTVNIETPNPEITRSRWVTNTVDVDGVEATVTEPSVYSRITFEVNLPVNIYDTANRGTQTVTTSAMCGVEKNKEELLEDLLGKSQEDGEEPSFSVVTFFKGGDE
jgi:hypothetical protein